MHIQRMPAIRKISNQILLSTWRLSTSLMQRKGPRTVQYILVLLAIYSDQSQSQRSCYCYSHPCKSPESKYFIPSLDCEYSMNSCGSSPHMTWNLTFTLSSSSTIVSKIVATHSIYRSVPRSFSMNSSAGFQSGHLFVILECRARYLN